MPAVERRRWACPWCGKQFDIPATADDPAACPECVGQTRKPAPPAVLDDDLRLPVPPHAQLPPVPPDPKAKKPQPKPAEVLIGCLVLLVLVGIPIGAIRLLWPSRTPPAAVSTVDTTSQHVVSQNAQAFAAHPFLPGLEASTVYLPLEAQGFQRQGSSTVDDPAYGIVNWWDYVRERDGVRWSVTMFGKGTRVASIQAVSVCTDPTRSGTEAGKWLLGFVSTAPYDGSSPAKARAWVERYLGRQTETSIGGVRFELSGRAQTVILHMAPAR